MKVNDLIELLKSFPPNAEVIISKDSEGNEFSPVDEVSSVLYSPKGNGEVYGQNEREQAGGAAIDAVVVFPLDSYRRKNWNRDEQSQQYS
jgi:hypothetical protein